MFSYAVAKDQDNEKRYFVSYSHEEINAHCSENNLEIIGRPEYVEPGMVAHHFIWIGEDKRPPLLEISRPYKY